MRRRRMAALLIGAGLAVLIAAGATAILVAFNRSEARLAAYCRGITAGTSLGQAIERANENGLSARLLRMRDGSRGVTGIRTRRFSSWGSFCTLHHRGGRVDMAFHNPWYH